MIFRKKNSVVKNNSLVDSASNINIPQHVAIIMDGNFRWAKAQKFSLQVGHKKGTDNIENIVDACMEIGVKFLTVYAFSSENWNRPKDEVAYLMKLLDEYLEKDTQSLMKKNVKILISGDLRKLAESTKQRIKAIEDETRGNVAFTLNVAFSYGGRQEIVDAVKKITREIISDKIFLSEKIDEKITENLIAQNLYQPQIPDPDLLIRTGGDQRISNFLLWQSAYTEFYFTEIFWPDFSKKNLLEAIINFNQRERKYGKR